MTNDWLTSMSGAALVAALSEAEAIETGGCTGDMVHKAATVLLLESERDRRAENWLLSRHQNRMWTLGNASQSEWAAAYAAVDAS